MSGDIGSFNIISNVKFNGKLKPDVEVTGFDDLRNEMVKVGDAELRINLIIMTNGME